VATTNFTSPDAPTWDLYSRCIHCGLCLQQCPTYRLLGREADSPRGRIYQVLLVDAGRLAIADSFVTHIDRCLGCRACETACPSGVHYGRILERARAEIERNFRRPWLTRKLRDYFYLRVLHKYSLLSRCAKLLRFYQRSGLQGLARSTGILKLLGLARTEALAPRMESSFFFREIGTVFPCQGERRGRVLFLAGCIASVAAAELNRATIRVLNRNGVEVFVPPGQRCCGALQAHAGYLREARHLARRNISHMMDSGYDAIVTNAAGCGATLKEYGELLAGDPKYAADAREFSGRVQDVNEYLAAIGLRPPPRPLGLRVTYQDACHLTHGQRIRSAPRELLAAIGVDLVEMPHADHCCGSAGTYNVTHNELSMKLLEEKMNEVAAIGPDVIATANLGCTLQFRAGVKARGLKTRVAHVVELLDEAFA
jgi:glycolate oxidase iron-sulfur subunit